jgi:hypothetical protein
MLVNPRYSNQASSTWNPNNADMYYPGVGHSGVTGQSRVVGLSLNNFQEIFKADA